LKKLIKFALVGGTGGLVMLGMTFLLTHYAGLYYLISYTVGFIVSLVWCYYWNTRWTFGGKQQFTKFILYGFVSSITLGINLTVVYLLTANAHFWYILSAAIGIVTSFGINYVVSRSVVWGQSPAILK
jgi:putative flippase GtrA